MNNSKHLGLYAAVIAVSVGVIGAYGFTINPASFSSTPSSATEGTPILGHVTVTLTDPSGHVKQYLQGDNTVQINAKDCVGKAIFGVSGSFASTVCTGALTGNFTKIAISGSGAGGGAYADNADALTGELTSNGLSRLNAQNEAATWTDAVHNGAGGTEVVQSTFTNSGGSQTVGSAGLFNSTSVGGTGGMFAAQNFATGVTLGTNDAITVKWTITVG